MTTAMKYSEPELNAAFKRVQNPYDWREPIDCIVYAKDQSELDVIVEAIMFYTATKATIRQVGIPAYSRTYRITAVGYRAGPAGP